MAESGVLSSPFEPVEYRKASIYATIQQSYQKWPDKIAIVSYLYVVHIELCDQVIY